MTNRKKRVSPDPWLRNAAAAWEIAFAAPQVIAHRCARMATAGHNPNARDRAEFSRMGTEKVTAFSQSLAGMSAAMLRMNQDMALSAMQQWGAAWSEATRLMVPGMPAKTMRGRKSTLLDPMTSALQMSASAARVVEKGLTPVRKRASANAKRLAAIKR